MFKNIKISVENIVCACRSILLANSCRCYSTLLLSLIIVVIVVVVAFIKNLCLVVVVNLEIFHKYEVSLNTFYYNL